MTLSANTKSRLLNKYGEWAIVTGATSGIGLELATQLASAGFKLILNARNLQNLQSLAQELQQRHQVITKVVAADVSESAGVDQILSCTHPHFSGFL